MGAKTDPINEDLYDRLSKHFSEDDWWVVHEVGLYNSAQQGGDAKYRSADAFCISKWASRAHEIHGVEVKATRADWLAELREPAKADACIRICRRWWVLAPPDVVKREELPQGWGLLVPSNSGLRREVDGGVLPDPADPPRSWWTHVFRRLEQGKTLRHRLAAARAAGERAGRNASTWKIENERDRAVSELETFRENVAAFEKASGLKVGDWDSDRIGEAVKVVLEQRDFVTTTGHALENIRRAVKDLDEALGAAGWSPVPQD